jgi:arginase family enzyme
MSESPNFIHIDLDGAATTPAIQLGLPTFDAPDWGPHLRYCAPSRMLRSFYEQVLPHLKPFVLTGSGDFHHLTALWLKSIQEPFTLIVFDNHPDWDIRPPRWSCGGWVNRALEHPHLQRVIVWGCGNFELRFPSRLFANRRALKNDRLEVRPWAERLSEADRPRYRCLTRSTWKEEFASEVEKIADSRVYVSIDVDCLGENWAFANWENGLFEPEDLVWAMQQLHARSQVIGGDLCGAFSPPRYAHLLQRLIARIDHPPLAFQAGMMGNEITAKAITRIWPSLVG